MAKVIHLLCIFFSVSSCYEVERNCNEFRTGTFSYTTLVNSEIQTSRFYRDTLFEIEEFMGKIDTSRVRWINDCEFILTKLNPKNNLDKKPIRIKILTTNRNQYTFEYAKVGDDRNIVRGTVIKEK